MTRGSLAACAVLAVLGCRGRPEKSSVDLRLPLEGTPPHLNPLVGGDLNTRRITVGDVYEPLWAKDGDTLVPVLAESFARSPDDLEWTFRLRRGVTWHDGAPFSARDVAFTLALLRPGQVPSPYAADFDDLTSIETPDTHTVTLRFHGFRVGRDATLAHVAILPEHRLRGTGPRDLLAHDLARSPVGTGPYVLSSFRDREIVLVRNAHYWGPRPAIARVTYVVVADRMNALARLRSGELDLLERAPGPELAELGRDPRFVVMPYDGSTVTLVVWNCRGKLSDARIRRALSQLLDRESIVREIYRGQGKILSGPWMPGSPAYDPLVLPWPYDPAHAQVLLGEAGAGDLVVRLLLPKSPALERVATVWQDDARRAGVTLSIETLPYGETFFARARSGEVEGALLSLTTSPEQDFYAYFHSSGTENYGGFADSLVDQLLTEIRATPEAALRHRSERALHRRLHELEPITLLMGDVRVAVASRRLLGVTFGPDGLQVRRMLVGGR